MSSGREELPSVLDYRAIKRALGEISSSVDGGPSGDDLRSSLSGLGSDPDREDFKKWYKTLDGEIKDHLADQFIRNKKKYIIDDKIGNKKKYIEDSVAEDTRGLVDSLTLGNILYHDSFFRFADRTSTVHKLNQISGVFKEIKDKANSRQEAQEIFCQYVDSESSIDDVYKNAVGELPAPIIGDVDYYPKPRFIHFTGPNRMYIEYWKTGSEITRFDVNRSDYMTITTRSRTAVRVDVESGIIEFSSDDDSDDHRKAVLDELVDNFGVEDPSVETDGGLVLSKSNHQKESISSDDVEKINENIGVMSTLDSFRGNVANTSLHSIDERPVDEDKNHEELKERGYIKSHPKLLLGVKDGDYELLDPDEVYDDYAPEDEVPSIPRLVDEIQENSSYDSVERYTIVLNADEGTFRIWKSAQAPRVREMVFKLVAEELNWGT